MKKNTHWRTKYTHIFLNRIQVKSNFLPSIIDHIKRKRFKMMKKLLFWPNAPYKACRKCLTPKSPFKMEHNPIEIIRHFKNFKNIQESKSNITSPGGIRMLEVLHYLTPVY
jgi:hypothetical protein